MSADERGRWYAAERADYSPWKQLNLLPVVYARKTPMQMFTHTNKSYCVARMDRRLSWPQLLFSVWCAKIIWGECILGCVIDSYWFFFIVRLVCTDLADQDLMELLKVIHDSLELRQHPPVCSAPPSQHQRASSRCPGIQRLATTHSANHLSNAGGTMSN